ncbi:MAG: 16S rRNA (guanine(527)-N(7))-methyltransferase RsmG [Gammaproteobacteria bacterium]|nr:16S rRNA (guanine(527)-N(7))-methyltransferase RsmG [Gammaproteobacteria bacterium]|tara:strand:- start:1446 stop:2063 length:618 start_codon:yes stop_codon:yes gene_type:complete
MPALDKKFENLFSDLNIKHKEKKNIFCDYCKLIFKWNKKINLTAIDSYEDMMVKHIADSLSICDLIDGDKIADVGTGAGLPGVPLAIVHPNKNFLLIDSNLKKIDFLNHVKLTLGIENIEPYHIRIEKLPKERIFDTIVTRAYGSLLKLYEDANKNLGKAGRIVSMKGRLPKAEIDMLPEKLDVSIKKLDVPSLSAERHAIIIRM